MANAVQTAPETKKVPKEIEINGEVVIEGTKEHKALLEAENYDVSRKYMFELAVQNEPRALPVFDMVNKRAVPHKPFNPYRNIVFTSQIVWKGQRRMLRYYDGCDTIFSDKQPKDKEVIDQLIKQSQPKAFLDGKFGCYGDEKQLLLYLNICSWNDQSPFRTRTANSIFKSIDSEAIAQQEASKIDAIEEALRLSKEASATKMMIHANFLGIALIDYDSGNELSEKAIRAAYRREASLNPESFIDSYGNKNIETKYFIEKALERKVITNEKNPNKAAWSNGTDICDISGLKSHEAISQKLFEFSQTEEGEEFLLMLKSVMDK